MLYDRLFSHEQGPSTRKTLMRLQVYTCPRERQMSEKKAPAWLRALDIVFGSIGIVLSLSVLLYPKPTILTLIFVLSIAALVVGIARIIIGASAKYLPDGLRAINVGAGILALVIALVAMSFPQLAVQVLIYLLSLVLLVHGIARIVTGGFARVFPSWLRGLHVVVGLLTIASSVVIFLFPGFGFLTLVFMLAIMFLVNGAARIISGITGIRRSEPSRLRNTYFAKAEEQPI